VCVFVYLLRFFLHKRFTPFFFCLRIRCENQQQQPQRHVRKIFVTSEI